MIVVAGSTGNIGGALVTDLHRRGVPVRAVTRDPARARFPGGVTPVAADLDRPESMMPAFDGADGAFLLSGYADMPGLLAAARSAGVRRVALLSSSSVPLGDMSNAVVAYHLLSERAVRESGIAGTILRPSMFMSNAREWAPTLAAGDVVRAPWAGLAAAVIDPADVAAVAAAALVDGGLEGTDLRLTGPEALTPAERLEIIGAELGRSLRLEPMTDEEAVSDLAARMPERYVDAFRQFYVDGALDESPVLPTVREVVGREPATFAGWVARNRDAFGG